MVLRARLRLAVVPAWLLFLALAPVAAQQVDLPEPRILAPGVLLYHLEQPTLVEPEGPISIWALRLDSARVRSAVRAGQRRDHGYGDCGWHRRAPPADRCRKRRVLSAERRSGRRHDHRRPSGQRYPASSRRGWHHEGCHWCSFGIRATPRQRGARYHRSTACYSPRQWRRHDTIARAADALHAVVSRPYRHRQGRARVGRRSRNGDASSAGRSTLALPPFHEMASCYRSAASRLQRLSKR